MKRYNSQMCIDAETLYKQGKYEECLKLALEAHELAKQAALDHWNEMLNGPPTELAKLTVMWDTTTGRNLKYGEYLRIHNWEDDIAPAPMRIAEKPVGKSLMLNNEYIIQKATNIMCFIP